MKTPSPIGSGVRRGSPPSSYAIIWLTAACDCAFAATPGGSLVATTNYVFRGLTQTSHGAAVQGDVHLSTGSGWFGGVWGSAAVSPPATANQFELNLYLGHAWTLSPDWTGSLHYARYLFPDERAYVRYFYDEYDEWQMGLSFQDRLTVSIAFAPDILRYSLVGSSLRRGDQWTYEGSFRQPLWRNLALTADLGHYDLGDLFQRSYWAWSTGVELDVSRLQFTLKRFGTDAAAREMFGRRTADGHWSLTAAWRF